MVFANFIYPLLNLLLSTRTEYKSGLPFYANYSGITKLKKLSHTRKIDIAARVALKKID
jgi:hypothetical protein